MSRRTRLAAIGALGLALALGAALAWGLRPGVTQAPDAPVAFIKVAELHRLLARGTPRRLVDVRSREEYLTRHLPGAVSIPLDALDARRDEIPRQGLVVLY